MVFHQCNGNNRKQSDDLEIQVNEEEDADSLINNIKEDWAEDHGDPAANVNSRDDKLEFREALEVSNVHVVVNKYKYVKSIYPIYRKNWIRLYTPFLFFKIFQPYLLYQLFFKYPCWPLLTNNGLW